VEFFAAEQALRSEPERVDAVPDDASDQRALGGGRRLPAWELIARVGKLMGAMAEARALVGAKASGRARKARASSSRAASARSSRVPSARRTSCLRASRFLRVESIEEAIEWASRFANVMGNVEIDIRP